MPCDGVGVGLGEGVGEGDGLGVGLGEGVGAGPEIAAPVEVGLPPPPQAIKAGIKAIAKARRTPAVKFELFITARFL